MLFPTRIRRFPGINDELRGALRCVALLLVVMCIGTVGFMLIEEWGLWQSLFFTLITITTVGYGDEGVSPSGEVFAAMILVLGIGTATYTFSSLVQLAVNYQSSWKRRMQSQISRLTGHFVICGHGRIGQTVASSLLEAGESFVVIEHTDERVDAAVESDLLVVQGNSTEDEILLQAGVDRARGIICVTDSDAENVFVTLSARELNPELFIAARASTEGAACKMRRAGANVVVSPYISAGQLITDAILRPSFSDAVMNRRRGDIQLTELTASQQNGMAGTTVGQITERFPRIVCVAVREAASDDVERAVDGLTLANGDVVTVAGKAADLETLYTELKG